MDLITDDFLTESLLSWTLLLLFENLLDVGDVELDFVCFGCGVFGGTSTGYLLGKMIDALVQLLILDC